MVTQCYLVITIYSNESWLNSEAKLKIHFPHMNLMNNLAEPIVKRDSLVPKKSPIKE